MSIKSTALLQDSIAPLLLKLTAPMVVGILALMFFQAVDTYFISMLGTSELAAISFTFPVTFTVTSTSLGLAIGASIMLGQAIGKGDFYLAKRITADSIALAILILALISILGFVFITPIFNALGAGADIIYYIKQYMFWWFMGMPLMVLPIMCNTLLRATGDTVSPSLLMAGAGLVNAALDPLLIFGWGIVPGFGIKGAAFASIIAWFCSCIGAFYLLRYKAKLLEFALSPQTQLFQYLRDWLKMSLPICFAHILTPIAAGILTRSVAPYGNHAVAALGAGARIESMSLVVTFALTAVLSAFVAQNLGAGKVKRSRKAIEIALLFSLLWQLFVYLAIIISIRPLAALFSDDPQVIAHTKTFLYIVPAGSIAYGLLAIISTAFNAAKRSWTSLFLSLTRLLVFFTPAALIGAYLGQYQGALIGVTIGSWLGTLFAYYAYRTRW